TLASKSWRSSTSARQWSTSIPSADVWASRRLRNMSASTLTSPHWERMRRWKSNEDLLRCASGLNSASRRSWVSTSTYFSRELCPAPRCSAPALRSCRRRPRFRPCWTKPPSQIDLAEEEKPRADRSRRRCQFGPLRNRSWPNLTVFSESDILYQPELQQP